MTPNQKFYFKSGVLYSDRDEHIPAKTLGISLPGNFNINMQRYGVTVGAGVGINEDTVEINLIEKENKYDSRQMYSSIKVDSLDNLNFPNSGLKARVKWIKELEDNALKNPDNFLAEFISTSLTV